ncbi:hypothetical protein ACIQXM_03250 [Arthrobacter sp. NPDC097144]|uniref:hypothetical protein n=1 Tax=Arthrobacter sp. NPDC097144 TaxID=3363946 RepID=UPI003809C97D
MLLGKPGIKADRRTVHFVNRANGRDVTAADAEALLIEAAAELEATPTEPDQATWAHERDLQDPVL